MFLTAAIIFIAAFGSAGATNTVAAPVILEGAVQQVDVESHEADLRLRGSIPLPRMQRRPKMMFMRMDCRLQRAFISQSHRRRMPAQTTATMSS